MSRSPTENPGPAGKPAAGRRGTRELLRTAGIIALVVLITLFAVLNVEEVKVDWVIGSGQAPLIVVIVIALLVGIVITYLAERVNRRRR